MKDIALTDVKPAFAERNVPVALATDENYLSYLKVTINSAIASSPGSNLDIIVLHAGIPEDAILDFTAGYAGVGNASVRFVDISDELETSGLSDYRQTARLPLSSCYRLLLPRILPAYDKIVYIDVDVAVCRDLGELYETDVGDNWFAAAKDVVYNTKPEYVFWAAKWGFAEWDGYVNAGVLVMNLERFRREPVFDRLKEIVFEAAKWNCDQDALNFVCKGAIAPLDPRWNVQLGDYCLKEQIALTGDEMWIAHFTGGQKPWKRPARRHSHLWWRHADASDASRLWARAWGDALVLPGTDASKVSVILPVFNAQLYLPEALASVLMQKEIPEIEVICIDDGSTDDSAEILEFWGKRDPRLHVIRQKNQGAGVARNVGLDVAKGEYIFFLDADDRLSSGAALRQAYEQAKADDLDVLIADGSVMDENGTAGKSNAYLKQDLLPEKRVFGPVALGVNLYLIVPMGPGAKLFRRAFLSDRDLRFPALKRSEDFPMVQLALSLARRLGVMFPPLVERRLGVATSLESTKDETPLIFIDAERVFREELDRRGLLGKYRDAVNASFAVRLAYNFRAVRTFASYKAIFDETRGLFAAWTSCGDGDGISEACRKAKAYLDDVFGAQASDSDLVQRFIDDCTVRIRGEARQRVEQLERDMNMLKSALQESQKSRGELFTRLQESQRSRGELFTRLQESQKSRGELFAKLQSSQKSRGELFTKLQDVQKSRGELFSKLQESQKSRGELFAKLQESQKSRGELFGQLQESQKSRGELFTRLQESQKSRGELFTKLQESQRSRGELFSKLKDVQKSRGELFTKLQEAQRSRGRLFTQLQESQKSRGELVKKLQKEQADNKIARESQDRLIGEYKAVLEQINEVVK